MGLPIATINKYKRLAELAGKSFVNHAFPNDFESYLIAFELVDSTNVTENYFMFPIMPEQLSESKKSMTTIRKTSSGINSLFNPTFNPRTIKLSGNFGRQFKVLMGDNMLSFSAVVGKLKNIKRIKSFSTPTFDISAKTGYGVTKLLDDIFDKSFSLDSYGRPYRLFFHNYALNTSYMVELESQTLSQNYAQSNMIWQYDIEMTAIAPTNVVKPNLDSGLNQIMSFNISSKALDTINKDLSKLSKNVLNRLLKK